MKQLQLFCLKSIFFVVTIILCSYICNYIIIDKLKAYFPKYDGIEIYRAIQKSKNQTKVRRLIIGDSTANQFFDNNNDDEDFISLTCNQAIGMCGHYFLLNNFLTAGNNPEEVYMIFTPSSFANDLDQIYTYHYFLKPFYRDEYKSLMSENVINQIKKIPFYEFSQLPLIISPAWAPNYKPDKKELFLSPISIEYLSKIDSLRLEHNFKLYIVPALTSNSKKNELANYNYDKIKNTNVAKLLKIYLDNIIYLPDNCYKDDVHLQKPLDYRDVMLNEIEIIRNMVDSVP